MKSEPSKNHPRPPTPPPTQSKNPPIEEPVSKDSEGAYFQGTDRTENDVEGDATEEDERR